jgi:hypothetical protein
MPGTAMTAESFAGMLGARQVGAGRWLAHCPAHPDKRPSLAIRQGERGVLLHCWSNSCTARQIVEALGLPMAALFDGSGLATPAQRAQMARDRAAREVELKAKHHTAMRQAADLRDGELLVDRLGALLAKATGDFALARLFHAACDAQHGREDAQQIPQDGPRRLGPAVEIQPGVRAWAQQIVESFSRMECLPLEEKLARSNLMPEGLTLAELAAWSDLHTNEKAARTAA